MSKEIQMIIDEEAEKKVDETRIRDIRNIKETTGWTTQQTMDAMRIPADQQARYAQMV